MTTRTGADGLTIGVEEEFLLVRPDGHLARSGPEVVQATGELEGELQEELNRCQVESATAVCTNAPELLAQLRELRVELAATAAERGLRLLPSGTPLLAESKPASITPRARYQRMARQFAAIADFATNCGCHVHVAIPDRATGVEISNRVRPWLPVLLAIAANSPFVDGVDSGYSSWRYVRWGLWPSAGPPPLFESVAHYDDSVEALLHSGAIMDRGMVYWDIRLSDDQPTLEFRVGDVATSARSAAMFGTLVRALVAGAMRDIERGRPAPALPPEVLRAHLWRAARDGLTGHCPHPQTGATVPGADIPTLLADHVRPLLPADDLQFVQTELARLRRSGGDAARQRAVYAERDQLTDVVDGLVRLATS